MYKTETTTHTSNNTGCVAPYDSKHNGCRNPLDWWTIHVYIFICRTYWDYLIGAMCCTENTCHGWTNWNYTKYIQVKYQRNKTTWHSCHFASGTVVKHSMPIPKESRTRIHKIYQSTMRNSRYHPCRFYNTWAAHTHVWLYSLRLRAMFPPLTISVKLKSWKYTIWLP